ncbi:MAG: vitamin K epoxide reductase family protein [Chloroflexi bacterium]|nr:MAG: vitamin K epoxide reductase family protein [Chloroflexota bacterium]
MTYIQRSGGQILILLLSLLGAGIAMYLTAVHYEHTPLICSTNGLIDCARVLSSSYSLIPGTTVPITIPGLGWCVVSGALAFIGLRSASSQRWLRITQLLWSFVGIVTALYLVYVEIVRLHTICAWCTALHVVILCMFLITLAQLQQSELEAEPETPDEKPMVTPVRNQR